MKKVDFAGSWVLVTGASSGIGAEFARKLAGRGANLILTARDRERLATLAGDLARVNGVTTRTLAADLAAPGGIDALLRFCDELGVSVEHVVNNAGFGSSGPFIRSDAGAERDMIRVNVEAVTAISRHFLPGMVAQRRGGLIQVASTAGHQPVPHMATYGATKAFVLSLSLALAEELRTTGVRVLALCPGPVPTGFQAVAGTRRASGMLGMATLEAPDVVEHALEAYDQGRTVVVPGAINSVQATAVRLMPRAIALRATKWVISKKIRPAGESG